MLYYENRFFGFLVAFAVFCGGEVTSIKCHAQLCFVSEYNKRDLRNTFFKLNLDKFIQYDIFFTQNF